MLSFFLSATGCATTKDYPVEPRHSIYIPMYGDSVHIYQSTGVSRVEAIKKKDIIGFMCFDPKEWEKHEEYVDKLKRGY